MAIEYALLGLLEQQPRHGYELSREFAADTVLGEIVHLEMSALYAVLKKLEREGFIEPTEQSVGSRPPRKVYGVTPAGAAELQQWLRSPVERTRDLRLEFLLKLYLANETDPALVDDLISAQLEICRRHVASLTAQLHDEADSFRRLVLEMRLAQNEALVRWLAATKAEVPLG